MKNRKWRRGFKIVHSANGKLRSFGLPTGSGDTRNYAPGAVTRPARGCGPLCVFGTRKQAEDVLVEVCAASAPYNEIRPCTYLPSRATAIWYWTNSSKTDIMEKSLGALRSEFPGTRLASAVRLSRRESKMNIRAVCPDCNSATPPQLPADSEGLPLAPTGKRPGGGMR